MSWNAPGKAVAKIALAIGVPEYGVYGPKWFRIAHAGTDSGLIQV